MESELGFKLESEMDFDLELEMGFELKRNEEIHLEMKMINEMEL